MNLFERQAPLPEPAAALAAAYDFATRCRDYAVAEIARRSAVGRDSRDWEVYRDFTEHALRELEDGRLDPWFEGKP